MREEWKRRTGLRSAGRKLAEVALLGAAVVAAAPARDLYILTSTNNSTNDVVIFALSMAPKPVLTMTAMLPTGGAGGASGNAGAVQFADESGAVVNYGSNNVSRLVRAGGSFRVADTIPLALGRRGWHDSTFG